MTGLAPNLHTAYGGLTAARLEMFLAAFRTPVLCHLAVEGQHLTVSSTSGVPSRNNAYFINLNEKSKLMPHYGTKAALSLPMPEGRGFSRFLVNKHLRVGYDPMEDGDYLGRLERVMLGV